MRLRIIVLTVLAAMAAVAPTALAKPGDIFLGDSSAGTVLRTGPNGGDPELVSSASALATPNSVEFDYRGRLLVTDYDAFGGLGGLLSVNTRTGAAQEIVGGPPFEQPDGFALAPGRRAYVSDLDGTPDGGLFEVNLRNGALEPISSGGLIADALGVAVEPRTGRVFVSSYGTSRLTEVDPTDGSQEILSTGPVAAPFASLGGIVRAADGTLYAFDDQDGGIVSAVDVRTGAAEVVATLGGISSYDMTIDRSGNLLVVAGGDGLYRVNPRNGDFEQIVENSSVDYLEGVGVEPPRCGGKVATITGTDRAERITGSPQADVIAALGGNDTVRGLDGADTICGGDGKDVLKGGGGRDELRGQRGRDKLNGGPKKDRCKGDRKRQRSC